MEVCFIMLCPRRSFDEWVMNSMMEREFIRNLDGITFGVTLADIEWVIQYSLLGLYLI